MATKQIVIVKDGFVLIGDVTPVVEGGYIVDNASVIRRWGTARGLGQIALEGPTGNTTLDPIGKVYVPAHAVTMMIECKV